MYFVTYISPLSTIIGFWKNSCCCQDNVLGEVIFIQWQIQNTCMIKSFFKNIWKLAAVYWVHKRRNSPTFILHLQWQWRYNFKALRLAYQIDPKPTLRWHKSIFFKAVYVCIAKSKWFKKNIWEDFKQDVYITYSLACN